MDIPVLGAFVLPLPFALLTYAWFRKPDLETLSPSFFHTWLALHIPAMFVAYALLSIAFAVGVAYLIQERQIKSKRPSALIYRLPSLDELDRLIYYLLAAAMPFLSAGLILGGLWAYHAWGRYWNWDPKETWTLLIWLVYGVYFYLRWAAGWRGRKTVYVSLAGFLFVMFTYAGVNYLSPLHRFLAGGG